MRVLLDTNIYLPIRYIHKHSQLREIIKLTFVCKHSKNVKVYSLEGTRKELPRL